MILSFFAPRGLAACALALGCAHAAAGSLHAQPASYRGTVTYEKVPVTRQGLALGQAVRTPAAGIRVELVRSPSREVLATDYTGSDGSYHLQATAPRGTAVQLRAVAATENVRVVTASGRREYAVSSPVIRLAPGTTVEQDLFAQDAGRISGPFNIARALWRANSVIRAAQPSVAFPTVEVRWDTSYSGGTFFRSSEKVAYINGRRSRDSDEFDDHVIIHEYGHFLMATLSREVSPGGDHGAGEQLDPRLAWSEGWADFLSAVVTGEPRYLDSGVERGRQTVLVETDLEQDVHRDDRPGIWSEHTVGSTLWDLYDDSPEPGDSLALGFTPLWNAFVGALRKEPDPYLLTFVDALARSGVPVRRLRQLLAPRHISYPEARDRFATRVLPGVPALGSVDSRGTLRANLLRSSAHYWFVVPTSRQVTVTMKITAARNPRRADLDLLLFDGKGNQVARSDATNGVGDSERIVRRLEPGYYRAEVRSWSGGADRLSDGTAHQGEFNLLVQF